ncbi:MAG: hypothetical protein FJX76_23090, partial [Armatimonadetes bacterium]|nr:hypothetical protein [Armatimonadota bacterium]
MKPGATASPSASISRTPARAGMFSATARIMPPPTATSMRPGAAPLPSNTVPLRIRKSIAADFPRPRGGTCPLGAALPPMSEAFLDALLTLPGMYEPSVSPDGRHVAWTWYRVALAADVYLAATDGSAPPMRMTDTPDNTFVASWTVDGRALIVGQDHDGDERVQLFRVDLDRPLHMEPLTPFAPPYFLRGGELHPNGRWLVYGANYDFERETEIEPTWVVRHDLETGERRVLARPAEPLYFEPELNFQGTHVLYSRADRDPSGQQIYLVDIDGIDDREILNFGDDVKVDATWCADGERVLFLVEAETHR